MATKGYTPETIIRKLREAEVSQGQGKTIAEVVKQLGVIHPLPSRWRLHAGREALILYSVQYRRNM